MYEGRMNLTANVNEPTSERVSSGTRTTPAFAQGLRAAGVLSLLILAGCGSTGPKAPIVDGVPAAAPSSVPRTTASSYIVRPGDTLFGIARANGIDVETIKQLNNLTDPNQLRVGQVLRFSAGGSTASSAPSAAQPTTIKTEPSQPVPLDQPAATPKPDTPVAVPPTTPAPDAGAVNWAWPASGALIQTFNANTKGIDISGTPGDPIKAAADGKVMYIGNGVRGLGNLVIINHDNGFITVYGHNRTLLVKTGQQIKRGDKIAELGQTDTTSPRLHFEIRRRGTPVDPLKYLPPK